MDLELAVPAGAIKTGGQQLEMPAGQHLKIETTPEGAELLDAPVPAGKVWTVTVSVHILETDA